MKKLIPDFNAYLIAAVSTLEDFRTADSFDLGKALRLLLQEGQRYFDEGATAYEAALSCAKQSPEDAEELPPPPSEIIVDEGTESVEASREAEPRPFISAAAHAAYYRTGKVPPELESLANRCGGIDEVEDIPAVTGRLGLSPMEEANDDEESYLQHAKLIVDCHYGRYCPQTWAERVNRIFVSGVSKGDYAILEAGPDHEWYYETWESVCDNALITIPEGSSESGTWEVHQSEHGDVWHVPVPPERQAQAQAMAQEIRGEPSSEELIERVHILAHELISVAQALVKRFPLPEAEASVAPDDVEGWAEWINSAMIEAGLGSDEVDAFAEEHIDKAHRRGAITYATALALARRFNLDWEEGTPAS